MKRFVVVLLVIACVPVGVNVDAQVQPRRLALVYDLSLPPLFAGDGKPADTAAFSVDAFLQRVRALETDHSDTRYTVALRGVACDELRLIGTAAAQRALAAIRRIAERHRILPTTYEDTRVEHRDREDLARAIRGNTVAIERCANVPPRGPFLPPDVSVTSSDATAALRRAGVSAVLSGYAVPPTEPRPRVVPAVVIGPEPDPVPDLTTARPEASAVVAVIDADRVSLIGELSDDERFETVDVGALTDLDVVGGVIDTVAEPSAEHVEAMRRVNAELEVFRSYTLEDNPVLPVYETILARAESTAWWDGAPDGIDLADRLRDTLAAQRERVSVSGGAITFTSRSGAVPVTIANDLSYPVRVRVDLGTAKMRFEGGPSRVVTIEPPGDTVTFEATALSTGTFPVTVKLSDPAHGLSFGEAQIHVRSAAANLSAVVLTAGGALFLVYWFAVRLRRRKRATP